MRLGQCLALGLLGISVAFRAQAIGLSEAYRLALEHDPKLAAARRKFQGEQERVPQARSRLLPRLSAEGNFTASQFDRRRLRRDPDNPLQTEEVEITDAQRSFEVALTLEQMLFDWSAWQIVDRAHKKVSQARLRLEKARQDLALRVGKAYLQLVLKARQRELARGLLAANEARWQKLQAQLEKGLTNRMEVLQAKVRTQQAKSEVINAKNQLELARISLERLIGEPVDGVVGRRFAAEQPPEDPLKAKEWVRQAQRQNMDVRIADANVAVRQEGQEAAYSQFLPTVSLIGRISETNAEDQVIIGTDKRVFLRMQIPLFEGGRNLSGVRESAARLGQARRQLDDAHRQATMAVRESLTNLKANHRNAQTLMGSVESARAFLEAAKTGFEQGIQDLVAVLDARADLFSAYKDLAKALHDELVARMELYVAAGKLDQEILGLLEERIRKDTESLPPKSVNLPKASG